MKILHTENEHFNNNQMMVYSLAKLYRRDSDQFYSIVNDLPTHIVLNDKNKLDYQFANSMSLNTLEIDDYKSMNLNNIQERSDLNLFNLAMIKIKEFDKRGDHENICSTIQRLYYRGRMNWIFGNKAIINCELFLNNFYEMHELYSIGNKIRTILSPLESSTENWIKFQSLTKKEKEILKLIAEGYTNKNIGDILNISDNSVRKHREHIRNKIDARNSHDIIRFADAFDLIGIIQRDYNE